MHIIFSFGWMVLCCSHSPQCFPVCLWEDWGREEIQGTHILVSYDLHILEKEIFKCSQSQKTINLRQKYLSLPLVKKCNQQGRHFLQVEAKVKVEVRHTCVFFNFLLNGWILINQRWKCSEIASLRYLSAQFYGPALWSGAKHI